MCGIAGVINSSKVPPGTVEAMTKVMAHRGPNGDGHLYQGTFAFGHRRLSIVDLSSSGAQPMNYLDRYVITYNGEVYNHLELRQELIGAGYRFNNSTDTEVIMAAYDHWGVDCLKKFNGMWAFVIYDSIKNEFFISRDRFGIKPLYYCHYQGGFAFASEVKALATLSDFTLEPNEAYLTSYLANGPRENISETAFKGVFKFPRASYLVGKVEEIIGGVLSSKVFWSVTPNASSERFDPKQAEQYAEQYYKLLEDAVRLRLRADVKIGSALSGGLDSSSIVYIVNKILREQGKVELQETFSSVYVTPGVENCDESYFIELMTKKLYVNSNRIEPKEADIPQAHEAMIWSIENPPEGTIMSAWHTFKKVHDTKVVVSLDGQGADEQLSGYLYYIQEYFTSLKLIEVYKEAKAFWFIPGSRRFILKGLLLAHFRFVFGDFVLKKAFKMIKGRELRLNLNEALMDDMESTLVTLIHYADHLSMAHSVESRMPFMDYRMVEFLASVPACYKMHNGWTKYLARKAFDKKIPDEICWRKDKLGWPDPEQYWYFGNLARWIVNVIQSSKLVASLSPSFDVSIEVREKKNIRKLMRHLNLAVLDRLFFSK